MQTSYKEWLETLKAGDQVRVRFQWDDAEVQGGRSVIGTVIARNVPASEYWRWMVEYDRHGDGILQSKCFYKSGSTGYEQIIPVDLSLRVVHDPINGYEFATTNPDAEAKE